MNRDPEGVLVAVPTRGEVQSATADRLQTIRDNHPGLPPVWYSPCHLGVTENQNLIAERFLEGEWDVLVLVEEDVIPSVNMLDICDRIPEYAITFQPYLMALRPFWQNRKSIRDKSDRTQFGLAYCVFEVDDRLRADPVVGDVALRLQRPHEGEEWMECYAVGTGCTAISRHLLEMLPDQPFKFEKDNGEWVGNDVMFCHQAQQLGFKVATRWTEPADHMPRTSLEQVMEAIR